MKEMRLNEMMMMMMVVVVMMMMMTWNATCCDNTLTKSLHIYRLQFNGKYLSIVRDCTAFYFHSFRWTIFPSQSFQADAKKQRLKYNIVLDFNAEHSPSSAKLVNSEYCIHIHNPIWNICRKSLQVIQLNM